MNTVSIEILDSSKHQDRQTKDDISGKVILVSPPPVHEYVSDS